MLTTLKRIVQEVNQIDDLNEALKLLAMRVQQATHADCCSIYLADYQQQHFTLMATEGLDKSAIGTVSIGFSEGIIGLIGQREEPLNIVNAQTHPRFKHYPEVHEEALHAFLGAPIIHQRKVLGVMTLQQKEKRRFSEDEEAFLVTLAAQLALEITHAEARGAISLADNNQTSPIHNTLAGIPGSAGLAIGVGFTPELNISINKLSLRRSPNSEHEIEVFLQAVAQTREQVHQLQSNLSSTIADDVKAIFNLYDQLLDASSLGDEVEGKIREGWSATSALKLVVQEYIRQFQSMQDSYMQERAVDVEDLANRVLANLLKPEGKEINDGREVPEQAILVADEVTASMLAEFPRDNLVGIISMRGSNNSHAAILARAMGVPAVMGVSDVPLSMLDCKDILLDGYSGEIVVSPSANARLEFQHLVDEEQELSTIIQQQQSLPAQTKDKVDISLYINAGLSAELEVGHSVSGEGVGLYRTEVPFMLRERFPSEQEQVNLYRSMLTAYADKQVTMRTLDVGGDKPLPYFPISEENPFLGWRGIRLTLDHPEIFLVQIRAMLRASIGLDNLQIMLPMITSVAEVSEAKRLIRQAFHEVSEESKSQGEHLQQPKIGVMIEVPSVLYQLPQLAEKVDFFSVGSNDLTQYLLAVDRNNARVADLYDSYHPAVLSAMYVVIQHANLLDVPVTVCGEMASEPGGAVLLMAMGYRKLSMNSHSLLKAKWVIRSIDLEQAQKLLDRVLRLDTPEQVRDKVSLYLESVGLGGLVRAGI